jgi:hypothetical protein
MVVNAHSQIAILLINKQDWWPNKGICFV